MLYKVYCLLQVYSKLCCIDHDLRTALASEHQVNVPSRIRPRPAFRRKFKRLPPSPPPRRRVKLDAYYDGNVYETVLYEFD